MNEKVMKELKELNTEELLGVILAPKAAASLVEEYGDGLIGSILNSSRTELTRLIGKASAKKVKCIAEILKRIVSERSKKVLSINTPWDVWNVMQDMGTLQQEEFRVILLNAKNKILAIKTVARGTTEATIINPKEVFAPAMKEYSTFIILVHNHPSGDTQPSQCDFQITDRLVNAGKLVGIKVLDHVIIGGSFYFSMQEKGHI